MNSATSRFSVGHMFRNLGIRARLLLCAAIPSVLIVIVAVVGLKGLEKVFEGTRLMSRYHRIMEQATKAEELALEMQTSLRGFLLTNEQGHLEPYEKAAAEVKKAFKTLKKMLVDRQLLAILEKAQASLTTWQKDIADPAIASRSKAKDRDEPLAQPGQTSFGEGEQAFGEFRQSMAEFRKQHETLMEGVESKVEGENADAEFLVKAAVPVVILVTFVIFSLLSGTIRRPLLEAESLVQAVIRGDLSQRIELEGGIEVRRLGDALTEMIKTIRGQADQILEGLNILSESTSQIASTGTQLAMSTSKASAAVSQTSSTVEEVKQAARLAGEKAKHVAESARKTVKTAASGTQATEDTIERMNLIKDQMESIAETVVKLSEQSQAIEEIVGAVQDLADQSNLLAVNASIEAARAGDQGKGFSVVAHEIKSLADQSREATEQIRVILDDTRKWVSAVVMATEQGGKAVDAGVEQSVLAGEAIRALAESVTASSQAASVIDAQSEQQVTGVDQVAGAIGNIDSVMRQNLEAASQLEGAAGRLKELGASLRELVQRYKA